jgi:predicted CoA-binding protein
MAMTTRELIEDFLGRKRLAVVGVSRNSRDFSRALLREFLKRGYDAVPVNPLATEVEGRPCVACVSDISPAVNAVLLMTPPELTEQVVRECADAGITCVWMYRALGQGAIHPAAVNFCRERGIRVIEGYCPLMFFADAGFLHRLHGYFMKLAGTYPS